MNQENLDRLDRIDQFLNTKKVQEVEEPKRVIKKKIITDSMTSSQVVSFGGNRSVGSRKKQNRENNQKNASIVNLTHEEVDDLTIVKSNKKHNKNALRVVFLGGVDEIGKNMTALEYGDDIIIIDCGLAFPSEDMPGVDLVIPDFTYVKENYDKISEIIFL